MAAWFEKYRRDRHIKPFAYSAGYIHNFKRSHRFTSRTFPYKRRPSVTLGQQEGCRARIEELLRIVPLDHILNTDETSWLFWPRRILTWSEINYNHSRVLIRGDGKENLTALATITASGDRLALFFLARGERRESSALRSVT
jgi:hypothetical protein